MYIVDGRAQHGYETGSVVDSDDVTERSASLDTSGDIGSTHHDAHHLHLDPDT